MGTRSTNLWIAFNCKNSKKLNNSAAKIADGMGCYIRSTCVNPYLCSAFNYLWYYENNHPICQNLPPFLLTLNWGRIPMKHILLPSPRKLSNFLLSLPLRLKIYTITLRRLKKHTFHLSSLCESEQLEGLLIIFLPQLPKTIPGPKEMLRKCFLSQWLKCGHYTYLSALGDLKEILWK